MVESFAGGSESSPLVMGEACAMPVSPTTFDVMRERKDPSIVVVVTPLLAIMDDQISS